MNKILFEVSYIGSLRGVFNIIFAFCLCIFLYYRFRKISRIATKVVIAFMVIYIIYLVKGYLDVVVQYKSGNYIEIEGTVQNYYYSKSTEYFTLDGVSFSCSSGLSWGYYPGSKNDSVVAGNGQHLRIRYIRNTGQNIIVYIEQMPLEENIPY